MTLLEYGTTYTKLILAGEYSILLGGRALTIPLHDFYARFEFLDEAADYESARESNIQLRLFQKYIEKHKVIREVIDHESFSKDIDDGLYLWSNVPYGYGLGSSGVVCAAMYKTYHKNKKKVLESDTELQHLRKLFAEMESFFHGQSSGIDPLACYVNKAMLISGEDVQVLNNLAFDDGQWFLLDTKISRSTGELVNKFIEYSGNHLYKQELEYHYLPYVNELITRIMHSNSKFLDDWASTRTTKLLMEAVSLLQMRYFKDMIPTSIVPVWNQGIDTGIFYLKLLGAGGGGYFLGFTHDKAATENLICPNGYKLFWLNI